MCYSWVFIEDCEESINAVNDKTTDCNQQIEKLNKRMVSIEDIVDYSSKEI